MPGSPLFSLPLAETSFRSPPSLRHWRRGVIAVIPLPPAEATQPTATPPSIAAPGAEPQGSADNMSSLTGDAAIAAAIAASLGEPLAQSGSAASSTVVDLGGSAHVDGSSSSSNSRGAEARQVERRELWVRCMNVEEADAFRHSIFDRQHIARLVGQSSEECDHDRMDRHHFLDEFLREGEEEASQVDTTAAVPTAAAAAGGGGGGGGEGGGGEGGEEAGTAGATAPPRSFEAGVADRSVVGLLPLVDEDGAAMRVRFTTAEENLDEAGLLAAYLECVVAPGPASMKRGDSSSNGSNSSSSSGGGSDGIGGGADSSGAEEKSGETTVCCVQKCGLDHMAPVSKRFLDFYLKFRRAL